ncbi:hypothetical protein KR009_004337 [Drosophila setifemur]|nr:hypothetical protein KR009_004337 [Drosophila setifemur]
MKSETLHKFLAFCPLLIACAWGQPFDSNQQEQQQPPEQQLTPVQRPFIFIKNNLRAEDAGNYKITIPKDPKTGEPCLTISWKTNPDGSGPDFPQIYMGNGYLGIMPPAVQQQHRQYVVTP